jgi:hypothetical protein
MIQMITLAAYIQDILSTTNIVSSEDEENQARVLTQGSKK